MNQSREKTGVDIGDTSLKYNSRTLKVDVLINSDEPIEQVVARIQFAARGPKKCMVLIGGGEVDTETANQTWSAILPRLQHQAKRGGNA